MPSRPDPKRLHLSLAALLLSSGLASASVTVPGGTATLPGTVSSAVTAGESLDIADVLLNVTSATPQSFYDDFVFTVAPGQELTLSEVPLTASASLSVLGSTITLASFTGNTSNLSGISDTFLAGSDAPGAHLGGSNPDAGLSPLSATGVFGPGTYTLEVSGLLTGKSTLGNLSAGLGAYAQNLHFASAVPEPGSYGLIVASFAAIGLGLRRRQTV